MTYFFFCCLNMSIQVKFRGPRYLLCFLGEKMVLRTDFRCFQEAGYIQTCTCRSSAVNQWCQNALEWFDNTFIKSNRNKICKIWYWISLFPSFHKRILNENMLVVQTPDNLEINYGTTLVRVTLALIWKHISPRFLDFSLSSFSLSVKHHVFYDFLAKTDLTGSLQRTYTTLKEHEERFHNNNNFNKLVLN